MDKIKVAAGIASAVMLMGSFYTFFNMPLAAEEPETAYAECLGRVRAVDEIAEINALAKMLWGEARGVKSTTEKAACVWVVLNRVDDDRWPDNVIDVLEQPLQFGGYSYKFPVEDWAREIAADVYDRWCDERETGQDSGRVIPSDYYFWRGEKGCKHNWFRKTFDDYTGETYTFDEVSPYED